MIYCVNHISLPVQVLVSIYCLKYQQNVSIDKNLKDNLVMTLLRLESSCQEVTRALVENDSFTESYPTSRERQKHECRIYRSKGS
jgi:hypothetical protein